MKFGKWTVVRPVVVKGVKKLLCRCECGTELAIVAGRLEKGLTKQCNECRKREQRENRKRSAFNPAR